MSPRKTNAVKIVAAALALAFVCVALYVGVPHLTGSVHNVPANAANSPSALMEWTLRAITNDEPQKVWNAMTDAYRAEFSGYFGRVKSQTVDTAPWLKAAKDAGLASNPDELKELPDPKMFRVWWRLADRGVVGLKLPAFLRTARVDPRSVWVLKVFYDVEPQEKAKGGFVLYTIGNESDIATMSRVTGGWRLDIPREIPAGL